MEQTSYLDYLSEDLLIKIINILTENIDKTLLSIESTIKYIDSIVNDDSLLDVMYNSQLKCSPYINSLGLSICKNIKPKKMKVMINNKLCYIPYDVYDIYYGYIKYEIPDKYLNSYTYLFSRYPLNNVIIILKQYINNEFFYENMFNYIEQDRERFLLIDNNGECQVILQSPVLKNPQYFDILRETNKLYIKLSKFRYYMGPNYVLNKILHINKKGDLKGLRYENKDVTNYKYYNITPEEFEKYNYITTNVLLL